MTISAPNFTRLQDGIKSVDDLRVRGPLNVALAYLGGNLVTQLNTHFGAVSNSISAALVTFLATANTWTAAQTIALPSSGTPLTLRVSDDTAANITFLLFDRASATPANNDVLSGQRYRGRTSGGGAADYVRYAVTATNVSTGNESGLFSFITLQAGAEGSRMAIGGGVQIGSPTGGDPGADNLNVSGVIQKDGTQVVSSRVTGYGDPFGAVSRATFSITTVTTAGLAAFVAAMYTDIKAHGLIGN
jgi:hypothetical protein